MRGAAKPWCLGPRLDSVYKRCWHDTCGSSWDGGWHLDKEKAGGGVLMASRFFFFPELNTARIKKGAREGTARLPRQCSKGLICMVNCLQSAGLGSRRLHAGFRDLANHWISPREQMNLSSFASTVTWRCLRQREFQVGLPVHLDSSGSGLGDRQNKGRVPSV